MATVQTCGTATNTPVPPTATATATATACTATNYNYTLTTGTMTTGTTRIDGAGCDDCTTLIPSLPFPFTLYGTTYTAATVGSNGILAFGTANDAFGGSCLPVASATNQMMPFYRDERTDCANGCGIYTVTTGTAPNRIFTIEYRTIYFGETSSTPTLDYEVNLYESGSPTFDYTYGLVNATTQTGRTTSIGVQRDSTSFTQYACDPTGQTPPVSSGQRIVWTPAACGTATNTRPRHATRTSTPNAATSTPTCQAGGGPINVLIVYSDNSIPPATLISQIQAESGVGTVNTFDASASTPTLAQLEAYTEVVAYSNSPYGDPVGMGNVLADYQDAGGIVVATAFDWFGSPFGLDGRWMTGGYTPFTYPATINFANANLGTYDPSHPLMQGVTTLSAYFRETSSLTAGATQVAAWDDNTPAIAVKTTGGHTAVAINAYLGDNPEMWSGQFGTLIVNAARWLAGGSGCGPTNTPVATSTPTSTPTCQPGGGGLPGPWANGAPSTLDAYGAASASDGTVAYFAGGYSFTSLTTNVFQKYNPATNTWTTLANVPVVVSEASLAYSPTTNKLYLFGGEDVDTSVVYNTLYIYDVATNTWSTGAAMPDVRAFMASGYFNGKVYLVGGYNSGSISPAFLQVWEYNISTNTYATKTPIPAANGFGGAGYGVIGGHLYVAGGRDATNTVINTLWDYNIAADSWASGAAMPAADNVPGSGVIMGSCSSWAAEIRSRRQQPSVARREARPVRQHSPPRLTPRVNCHRRATRQSTTIQAPTPGRVVTHCYRRYRSRRGPT